MREAILRLETHRHHLRLPLCIVCDGLDQLVNRGQLAVGPAANVELPTVLQGGKQGEDMINGVDLWCG